MIFVSQHIIFTLEMNIDNKLFLGQWAKSAIVTMVTEKFFMDNKVA